MKGRRYGFALLSIVLACTLGGANTWGAGFSIFEQGTRAMGRSSAFTATADDPSAIFFNPAGLAFQNRLQIYIGGTLITPNADFEGTEPFPGTGVRENMKALLFFPPHTYVTYQVLDGITVGLGVFSDFGLSTEWENPSTFTGRYISTKSSLRSFTINPAVGFKVSEQFALGVGINLRSTSVELNRYIPFFNPFTFETIDAATVKLDSDTKWSVGFNAGLLYKILDNLRFGFSYRHHQSADLTGTASFHLISTGNPQIDAALAASLPAQPIPVQTTIRYPKVLSAGLAYDPWETWQFEVNINWMEWSRFDKLDLTFPDNPTFDQSLREDWDDAFSIRLGAEKVINRHWTVRGGFLFDETPQPIQTATPILPDASRFAVNLGVTIHFGERWSVDVAEMLLFFKDRTTGADNDRGYSGKYSNFTNLAAVSLGYRF